MISFPPSLHLIRILGSTELLYLSVVEVVVVVFAVSPMLHHYVNWLLNQTYEHLFLFFHFLLSQSFLFIKDKHADAIRISVTLIIYSVRFFFFLIFLYSHLLKAIPMRVSGLYQVLLLSSDVTLSAYDLNCGQ